MDKKLVAIHQPNFFPWLGFFNKISVCDVFIILDQVQFSKTGGNWSNRVRIAIGGHLAWLTAPVVRSYHGVRRIADMQINNSSPWRQKMLKTLQMAYSHAPYFREIFPFLEPLVNHQTDNLAAYNIAAIRSIGERLQIPKGRLVLGSTLGTEGKATDLLIAMVKAVGGTSYLCGGGAEGYQENGKFPDNGIELRYQNFVHPTYPQINAPGFTPGLSIVDVLMNCGFETTAQLMAACR